MNLVQRTEELRELCALLRSEKESGMFRSRKVTGRRKPRAVPTRKALLTVTIQGKSFKVPAYRVNCRRCGKEFLVKRREHRRGRGKCCSVKCALSSRVLVQNGAMNSRSKLTWANVRQIRQDRELGVALWVLAADYGVTEGNIWAICSKKTWKE